MLARFLQPPAQHEVNNTRTFMWRKVMVESIVQLVIVGMWAVILGVHTRRLLRLAKVESLAQWGERRLRPKLDRVWWWLGREEYWREVQADVLRCMQLTFVLFLMAWGIYG